MKLLLEPLRPAFAVCRLAPDAAFDLSKPFLFAARTDREVSLVCPEDRIPAGCTAKRGFRAFRVAGTLDFSLTGILSRITGILASREIPVFAVSTYDTDYVLVPGECFDEALTALAREGWPAGDPV